MTEFEPKQPEKKKSPSLASDVVSSLKAEVRNSLLWAVWGAGLGAIVLGAAGFWFFGSTGLAYGAGVGAIAGGLGAWFFCLNV
ncbi:MAG: hypothetical protein H6827_01775 [Planctomycetes bacterium]|nr:hypothetical protein [Planctomycetota bacterium]